LYKQGEFSDFIIHVWKPFLSKKLKQQQGTRPVVKIQFIFLIDCFYLAVIKFWPSFWPMA